MRFPPKAIGMVCAVLTVLIWTSFIVIGRASAKLSLNPLDIVFARSLGAAVVLLPWGWWLVRRRRHRLAPASARTDQAAPRADSFFGFSPLPLATSLQVGFLGGIIFSTLAYSAFVYAPAAHASVLMPGFLPFWTTLLVLLLLRERIPQARLFGLSLIMLGGLLVGGPSLLVAFDGGDIWKGDLMFLCASLGSSGYIVLARAKRLDPVHATIAITACSFFLFVPVFLLAVAGGLLPSRLAQAPLGEVVFQAFFQGVLSVAVSGITFTAMVRHFGPLRSTMMTSIVPGLSALGAVFFLGEPLGWNLVLGLTLVSLGMLFGVRGASPAPSTPSARAPITTEADPLARPAV